MEHIDNEIVRALIHSAQQGDDNALARIIEGNTGLIWSVVKRFTGKGTEIDDLYQLGSIGLIKAVRNFNFDYDVCFSTYAVPMIAGEIKRYLRDDGIIKVSRVVKSNSAKIKKYIDEIKNNTGKEPGVTQIANALNLECDDVINALELKFTCENIDDHENIKTLGEIDDNLVDSISIRGELSKLTSDERELIILRYYKEMTQVSAAKILGMTQVQVCRMEKRILKKLKDVFDS